ncbi:uncharacterized protein LOC134531356 [Bacillus rossius redtenbacheri]|uniref:uncharacterized protein LOC134531356 n=1 Tax=Bacillus rossius redtenbacheri TaxID=93214 RepID=UPI002FDE86B2
MMDSSTMAPMPSGDATSDGPWQTVQGKRPKRNHVDMVGVAGGPSPPVPSAAPSAPGAPAAPAQPQQAVPNKKQPIKPLFVFLDKGHNYPTIFSALKNSLQEKWSVYNRGRDQLQVQTASVTEYHTAIRALKAIGAQYSVLLQKDEIPKKFVFLGVHRETPAEFLTDVFTGMQLTVQSFWFLENRQTRQKCDKLVVEVPQTCDTDTILAIREFAGMIIHVEDYRHPAGPSQCSTCQRFSHVGRGCSAKPVCRWCSGPHRTPDCPHGGNRDHLRCANCGGPHAANYRGCFVYKAETRRHLPPQQRKERERQSKLAMRENRRAAAASQAQPQHPGPSGQHPGPSGQQGPPRPNPFGPPRYPEPHYFGQYIAPAMQNRYAPIAQEPTYNEIDYPAIANDYRPRRQNRGQPKPHFKKHHSGHKNGGGASPTKHAERDRQPATSAAPAPSPKPTPRAKTQAPPSPHLPKQWQ